MKKPFPVSLDEELIKWIGEEVKKGTFRNKSHLVEKALQDFKKKLEGGTLGGFLG